LDRASALKIGLRPEDRAKALKNLERAKRAIYSEAIYSEHRERSKSEAI
jgi:hypothetical protein